MSNYKAGDLVVPRGTTKPPFMYIVAVYEEDYLISLGIEGTHLDTRLYPIKKLDYLTNLYSRAFRVEDY